MKRTEKASKVYTPEDIADMLCIGQTSVYDFLHRQEELREFKVFRVGKLLRIEQSSFDQWINGGRDAC